jgi:galactoside O-acetyltransferase
MNSFYTEQELAELGLKHYGRNVLISRKCSIYSPEKISTGDNVRIDDFCILSGNITIGSHIHIAPYCGLFGSMGIEMHDYSGLSSRVTIYSAMDDFSGDYLVGPNQKDGTTNVQGGLVVIQRYAIIGTNTTVFPNITINEGAVIGAHSLVNSNIREWTINVGYPVRYLKKKKKELLNLI